MVVVVIFSGCSNKGGKPGKNNDNKFLSEIVINEHEKKVGEISEYGELYERYIYNPDGTLQEKTTNYHSAVSDNMEKLTLKYKYDDKKRVIEVDVYESDLFTKRIKYKYNSIDSISNMLEYDNDGNLNKERTYEYDLQKRLIRTVDKDLRIADDSVYINEYRYDGKDVYIKSSSIYDGSSFSYLNKYDSYGNLLQETCTTDDGGKLIDRKYKYEYDSSGHIQQKSFTKYTSDDWTYYDYSYNDDGTINKISVSYSYNDDESELRYNYIWK